jgi:dTDP-4-dehydrorhamnose reductase
MKKYLILGGTGLLGSRLVKQIENSYATYFQSKPITNSNFYYLDGSDNYQFDLLLKKITPDVVINCIGFTDVDKCELFPEKCWKINCNLAINFAKICALNSVKFVQISTDHYLNNSNTKLSELDEAIPVNQYSFSKYFAEKMISRVNSNALVLRTNFFHFNLRNPQSFLDKLIFGAKLQKSIRSFNDVIFSPVSTTQLINRIFDLIDLNLSGLVNISSNEAMSKYDFHNAVLDSFKIDSSFHSSVSIDVVNLPTLRPKFMALNNSRVCNLTNSTIPSIYDMIDKEVLLSKIEEESYGA